MRKKNIFLLVFLISNLTLADAAHCIPKARKPNLKTAAK